MACREIYLIKNTANAQWRLLIRRKFLFRNDEIIPCRKSRQFWDNSMSFAVTWWKMSAFNSLLELINTSCVLIVALLHTHSLTHCNLQTSAKLNWWPKLDEMGEKEMVGYLHHIPSLWVWDSFKNFGRKKQMKIILNSASNTGGRKTEKMYKWFTL